MKFEYGAMVEK